MSENNEHLIVNLTKMSQVVKKVNFPENESTQSLSPFLIIPKRAVSTRIQSTSSKTQIEIDISKKADVQCND